MSQSYQAQAYRIKLAYVGTQFSGFQSQKGKDAVQDELERALRVYFRHPIRIRGASRTDRGVHAESQIVLFKTDTPFELFKWKRGLNAILHPDVKVRSIETVAPDFDPIRSAKAKVYRYRIWLGDCDHPIFTPYVYPVHSSFDTHLFKEEAKHFIGHHDFSSFCNQGSFALTKDRHIYEIEVEQNGRLVDFWILGNGFLKQMVRIIVGTLIEIALAKRSPGTIPQIIAAKNREEAGETAGAKGLSLVEIFYDDIPSLKEVTARAKNGFTLNT